MLFVASHQIHFFAGGKFSNEFFVSTTRIRYQCERDFFPHKQVEYSGGASTATVG